MDGGFRLIGLFPLQEPIPFYMFIGTDVHPEHIQLKQTHY